MSAFPPLLGNQPEVLILGSMPSQRSLLENQYYAHPRNAFWWILARMIGFSDDLSYDKKCHKLISANYALWDVLYDCQRKGSLDSNIQRHSEQVNDFESFLKQYQSIKLIAFNGAAARQIFMRHCRSLLDSLGQLGWVQLPSSSPAYASLSREKKLQIWQDKLHVA